MIHSGLQFKDTVYPGREVMAVELEVDWSHYNHNQETGSRELSFSFISHSFQDPSPGNGTTHSEDRSSHLAELNLDNPSKA